MKVRPGQVNTDAEAAQISFLEAIGVLDEARSVEVFPDEGSWVILPLGEEVGGPTQVRVAFGEEEKFGEIFKRMFSGEGQPNLAAKTLVDPNSPFDGRPCTTHRFLKFPEAGIEVCQRCSAEQSLEGPVAGGVVDGTD